MRIYSRTGDRGSTSLFGGERVAKDDLRIQAYGSVDELNSLVGVIGSGLRHPRSNRGVLGTESSGRMLDPRIHEDDRELEAVAIKLDRIQTELMVLGSDLATPMQVKIKIPRVTRSFTARLEKEIDLWQRQLPQLKNFILPGGKKVGAKLHLARAVCRRAERSIVALAKVEKINVYAQIYVNRLSDWLYVAARYVNKLEKLKETVWKGRG